jgi:hypothetical protein
MEFVIISLRHAPKKGRSSCYIYVGLIQCIISVYSQIGGSEWIKKDRYVNKSLKTMVLGILVVLFGIALLLAFSGSFPSVNNLMRAIFVPNVPEQNVFVYGSLLTMLQNLEGLAFVVLCAGLIIGIVGFFYQEKQRPLHKDELVEMPLTAREKQANDDNEYEEVEEISLGKRGRLQMPSRSMFR